MQICTYFKSHYVRLQSLVNRRRRHPKQRASIQISAPFGFQHVASGAFGISSDEIHILREKAIASRFSTLDELDTSQRPPRPYKSRSGYRGLTQSTLTASRPSITRSFAVEDDASQLSPASTTTTTTTTGSIGSDREVKKTI